MEKTLELYDLAEALKIEVDCFAMNKVESMSMMDEDGDCFIAMDPFKLLCSADECVKLAHEIGHCINGAFYNQYSKLDSISRHEYRATIWSIKYLLPESDLREAVEEGCRNTWEISEYLELPQWFVEKAIEYYRDVQSL